MSIPGVFSFPIVWPHGQNIGKLKTPRYAHGQNIGKLNTPRYAHGQNIGKLNTPRYAHGQNIGKLNPTSKFIEIRTHNISGDRH
jgi:uncharacterized Rossmann fold enzyme